MTLTLDDIIALIRQGVIRVETEYDENEELHVHIWLNKEVEYSIAENAEAIHRYLSTTKNALPPCKG